MGRKDGKTRFCVTHKALVPGHIVKRGRQERVKTGKRKGRARKNATSRKKRTSFDHVCRFLLPFLETRPVRSKSEVLFAASRRRALGVGTWGSFHEGDYVLESP